MKWSEKVDITKQDFVEKWNELEEEAIDHLVVPDGDVIPEIIRIDGGLFGMSPSLVFPQSNIVAFCLKLAFANDLIVYAMVVFEYMEEEVDLKVKLRSNSRLEIDEIRKKVHKAFTD